MILLFVGCIGTKDTVDSARVFQGTATPSCAPWDGEAYTFTLPVFEAPASCDAPPAGAYVRIAVWDSAQLPLSAGDSFTFDDTGATGGGWSHPTGDPGTYETASSGSLSLVSWSETAGGVGTWTLTLADGSTLSGGLDALWCPADILCG